MKKKHLIDGIQVHILSDGSLGIASMKKKTNVELASILTSAAQLVLGREITKGKKKEKEKARIVVPQFAVKKRED